MASLHTLESARLADVEGGYGESIDRLHRTTVEVKLNLGKVLDHLGVAPATAAAVETAIDQE